MTFIVGSIGCIASSIRPVCMVLANRWALPWYFRASRWKRGFCAVVADSAFSSFRAIAYDRVGYYVHLGRWFGQTIGRLPVEVGLVYAKWRYGLDLENANPEEALAGSATPVLLIHGTADVNIRPWHSERMAAEFPSHVQLWEVPGAQHGGAVTLEHEMFQMKLVGWFNEHLPAPNRL